MTAMSYSQARDNLATLWDEIEEHLEQAGDAARRLVYRVYEDVVDVLQARYHYR